MKTLILLLMLCTAATADWKTQDGVVVQKIGKSDLFVFPSQHAVVRQIGTIRVGNTITVMYGIRINKNSKARFIAMDSGKVKQGGINPELKTNEGDAVGFIVRDTRVPTLDIEISTKLMAKAVAIAENRAKALNQAVSREANMSIEFTNEGGKIKIGKVTVN